MAASLLEELIGRNVRLKPRHIRGKVNMAEDALSRDYIIQAEWELDEGMFRPLGRLHDSRNHVPIQRPPSLGDRSLGSGLDFFRWILVLLPTDFLALAAEKL